ncbi:hypothetical protein DFH09DRAFT_1431024 [Mycena vulgaris]|nr:hypothetical protein DFH09DRAFT_1431024 [Mycena vulgaris]
MPLSEEALGLLIARPAYIDQEDYWIPDWHHVIADYVRLEGPALAKLISSGKKDEHSAPEVVPISRPTAVRARPISFCSLFWSYQYCRIFGDINNLPIDACEVIDISTLNPAWTEAALLKVSGAPVHSSPGAPLKLHHTDELQPFRDFAPTAHTYGGPGDGWRYSVHLYESLEPPCNYFTPVSPYYGRILAVPYRLGVENLFYGTGYGTVSAVITRQNEGRPRIRKVLNFKIYTGLRTQPVTRTLTDAVNSNPVDLRLGVRVMAVESYSIHWSLSRVLYCKWCFNAYTMLLLTKYEYFLQESLGMASRNFCAVYFGNLGQLGYASLSADLRRLFMFKSLPNVFLGMSGFIQAVLPCRLMYALVFGSIKIYSQTDNFRDSVLFLRPDESNLSDSLGFLGHDAYDTTGHFSASTAAIPTKPMVFSLAGKFIIWAVLQAWSGSLIAFGAAVHRNAASCFQDATYALSGLGAALLSQLPSLSTLRATVQAKSDSLIRLYTRDCDSLEPSAPLSECLKARPVVCSLSGDNTSVGFGISVSTPDQFLQIGRNLTTLTTYILAGRTLQ